MEPDQISHTQSMVAKRGLTNRIKRSYPCANKSLKTQRRIPTGPAVLAAIGHRLTAKKKKTKNPDMWVWGDVHRDQKLETFFWPLPNFRWFCHCSSGVVFFVFLYYLNVCINTLFLFVSLKAKSASKSSHCLLVHSMICLHSSTVEWLIPNSFGPVTNISTNTCWRYWVIEVF